MLRKRISAGKMCVTFVLPTAVVARSAQVVGDFNRWDERAHPMTRTLERTWEITLDLPLNCEFEFRYLVNGKEWINDWSADDYGPNPIGFDISVVSTRCNRELMGFPTQESR